MLETAIELSRMGPATSPAHEPPQKTEESTHQRKRKVWKLLIRWVWTVIFTTLIFAVAKIYLARGNITKGQKATHNLIQTALILTLGLNIYEAFDELRRTLQTRIGPGAGWEWDNQEQQLIKDANSLSIVCRLHGNPYVKPRMAYFCMAWLAINLIAQIAVALISLTYSMDDGTDFRGTYIREGIVHASNVSCYHKAGKCPETVTRHALAHDFGEYGTSSKCGTYNEITEVLNSTFNYPYYCRDVPHMREYSYRFNEYNFNDKEKSYPYFTNRIITARSGDCIEYDETNRIYLPDVHGNGDGFKISYRNDTFNNSISIPKSSLGNYATTYIYRGSKPPAEAKSTACGDRCITMWAYKNPITSNLNGTLYECPINVTVVSNAMQDAHKIPDGVAREAAASIALQGRWSGTLKDQHYVQYQFYAKGADYEIHSLTPDEVGGKMAKFALHSLATMVLRSPQIPIRGSVPYLGSRLIVYWQYFIPLLSCIVGVHFSLFIVTTVWITRVAEDGEKGDFVAGDIMNESREVILGSERQQME